MNNKKYSMIQIFYVSLVANNLFHQSFTAKMDDMTFVFLLISVKDS